MARARSAVAEGVHPLFLQAHWKMGNQDEWQASGGGKQQSFEIFLTFVCVTLVSAALRRSEVSSMIAPV